MRIDTINDIRAAKCRSFSFEIQKNPNDNALKEQNTRDWDKYKSLNRKSAFAGVLFNQSKMCRFIPRNAQKEHIPTDFFYNTP